MGAVRSLPKTQTFMSPCLRVNYPSPRVVDKPVITVLGEGELQARGWKVLGLA